MLEPITIIGLTGSIGMGKTTTAKMFEDLGIPTIGADDIVHQLYEKDAIPIIEQHFPKAIIDEKIDRKALAQIVLHDDEELEKLEALIHPLVREKQNQFIKKAERQGHDFVLLDIPLLFETGTDERFDKIIVVTCDKDIQKKRVLSRPNMDEEKFNAILSKQMPDKEKRKRADHIVDTSHGLEAARDQVLEIVEKLRKINADQSKGHDHA